MSTMLLKRRVMDPRQQDDISEALAVTHPAVDGAPAWREVPAYLHNWYPAGLRERTVGPHSRELVGITRFYPTLKPKVAVDFEPAPPELFYEDEKRRFCAEQHVVYIPIYIGDRLTVAEFKARYDAAKDMADRRWSSLLEDRALAEVTVEQWMQTPELLAAIDAECLRLCAVEEETSGKCYRGVARKAVLGRIKRDLLDELRRKMKNGTVKDPLAFLAARKDTHGVDGSGGAREPAHQTG